MARDEDVHRAGSKAHYEANRELRKEQMRAWRAANRERIREQRQAAEYRLSAAERTRRWRDAHPPSEADAAIQSERAQRYRRTPEGREGAAARARRWREAHPLEAAAIRAANNANRRAQALGLDDRIAPADVLTLWRQQPVCQHCGVGRGVDHIVALADDGVNAPANLQNLCHPCNRRKEGARLRAKAASRHGT